MNKKMICASVLLILCSTMIFSQQEIKILSSFRLQGEYELRAREGFNNSAEYRTLNHEGGVKVRVIDIGEKEFHNGKNGKWYYVTLTAPIWVDSSEWIEKYSKFWIFLTESDQLFEFEE
jgi:hypothetical protein